MLACGTYPNVLCAAADGKDMNLETMGLGVRLKARWAQFGYGWSRRCLRSYLQRVVHSVVRPCRAGVEHASPERTLVQSLRRVASRRIADLAAGIRSQLMLNVQGVVLLWGKERVAGRFRTQ